MRNTIKRNSTFILAKSLVNTNCHKTGDIVELHKEENGWIMVDSSGKHWLVFAAHIRNEHYFEILNQR